MNNKDNKIVLRGISGIFAKAVMFAFALVYVAVFASAQTATVTQNLVVYQPTSTEANAHCQITDPDTAFANNTNNRSYVTGKIAPLNSTDPWVNSALIEYSKITPGARGTGNTYTYPNNCLSLCAEVTCSNPPRLVEGSDDSSSSSTKIYTVKSGDFPIQSVLFEIFKYQQNSNPYNPDSTPPIRTIALYPTDGNNICYGVGVPSNDINNTSDCCDTCRSGTSDTLSSGANSKCSGNGICASTYKNFTNNGTNTAGSYSRCKQGQTGSLVRATAILDTGRRYRAIGPVTE